jgi:hypothetical protein
MTIAKNAKICQRYATNICKLDSIGVLKIIVVGSATLSKFEQIWNL